MPKPIIDTPDENRRFLTELDNHLAAGGRVTKRTVTQTGYPLGARAALIRRRHARGTLSDELVAELNTRDDWSWDPRPEMINKTWQSNYDQVAAYHHKHGTLAGLEATNPSLAKWVRLQRGAKLTDHQRDLLAQLGALDKPRPHEIFINAARDWLKQTGAKNSDAITYSTTTTVDGQPYALGRRAADYRSRYRHGQLPTDVIKAIERLPRWNWTAPRKRKRQEPK